MKTRGALLIEVIVFGSISVVILFSLVQWSILMIRNTRQTYNIELSEQIAEAGIEYYRWHLAHVPNDYKDGQSATSTGPYVHPYKDKDGNTIGQYSLSITAPPSGSTIVTINSTGQVTGVPAITKIVQVKMAIASFAKFAVVADDDIRFGAGTEVSGPVHSNGGIRFDGIAHNIVTSAMTTYDDPDHSGGAEFGVHTHDSTTDPLPPAAVPTRTDVFMAGRQFPIANVDFVGITTDLATMKTSAQTSGRYLANSGALGYHITLKTNDTFDVYRVNSLRAAPSGCDNSQSQSGWGTWSIGTGGSAQTFVANYANPVNGIIFVEDHVWVDGQVNSARITIASARFPASPSTYTSITVNDNLLYTNFSGTDTLALIAQNNINTGLYSADTLMIDAALMAINGRVGRYYYDASDCDPYDTRTTLNLFGMIGSAVRYGFAYTDGTGYTTRNITYDANLLYNPPPSFPLTAGGYSIVSWKQIK